MTKIGQKILLSLMVFALASLGCGKSSDVKNKSEGARQNEESAQKAPEPENLPDPSTAGNAFIQKYELLDDMRTFNEVSVRLLKGMLSNESSPEEKDAREIVNRSKHVYKHFMDAVRQSGRINQEEVEPEAVKSKTTELQERAEDLLKAVHEGKPKETMTAFKAMNQTCVECHWRFRNP